VTNQSLDKSRVSHPRAEIKELRTRAVELAGEGRLVFQCHGIEDGHCTCGVPDCSSLGKHPLESGWQKKATCDPALVDSYWERCPNTNIGIRTGKAAGVVVLDIDGEAGEATLKTLIERYGPLPETLIAITGRGRHLYFKVPAEPIRNGVACLGPGVDIRGDGGYVVAPPSRHANGRIYEWSR
jgi:hypothetical protein